MISQLLKENDDEIKHKDFCVDEFNTNQLLTEKKDREKQDLIAKIEDLEMTIKALTEAIETLKAEIAEMQVQLKRASGKLKLANLGLTLLSFMSISTAGCPGRASVSMRTSWLSTSSWPLFWKCSLPSTVPPCILSVVGLRRNCCPPWCRSCTALVWRLWRTRLSWMPTRA